MIANCFLRVNGQIKEFLFSASFDLVKILFRFLHTIVLFFNILFHNAVMSKEKIQEILIGIIGSIAGMTVGYLFWRGFTSELLLTFMAFILISLSFIVALVVTAGTKRLSA